MVSTKCEYFSIYIYCCLFLSLSIFLSNFASMKLIFTYKKDGIFYFVYKSMNIFFFYFVSISCFRYFVSLFFFIFLKITVWFFSIWNSWKKHAACYFVTNQKTEVKIWGNDFIANCIAIRKIIMGLENLKKEENCISFYDENLHVLSLCFVCQRKS